MKQPIKVTHVVYHFSTGGLENGIVNLINQLPETVYEHSILCLTGWDDEFVKRLKRPVHITSLNKKPGADWPYFLAAWKAFRRLQPDVVHTRNMATLEYQIPAWFAGVARRIHGEHGWDMTDLAGNNNRYRRLKQLLCPFVSHFVALSTEGYNYLVEQVGVSQTRCSQIINGVDIERFCPTGPTLEGEQIEQLNGGSVLIGTVGRLEAVKNQRLLLDAFAIARKHNPLGTHNWRLVIVGDGTDREMLLRHAKVLQIDQHTWFAGNRTDIPNLLRSLDLFVLPSLAEGISNTLLEAQATGTPVLATQVGGNAELIIDQKTGALCSLDATDMAQALLSLLSNQQQLSLMGKDARNHVESHFSLQGMLDRYHALYQGQPVLPRSALCAVSPD